MTRTFAFSGSMQTERLDMHLPQITDLPVFLAFNEVSDLTVGTYQRGRSKQDVEARLQRDINQWSEKGFGKFVLRRKGEDTVIGGAGLSFPPDWPSHELTWWLMPDARGQGFATEASHAVIDWAYDDLGWDTVETHMRDENAPAHRMAQRLGGTVTRRETFPDGVTRDVYAIPRRTSGAA